MDLLAMGLALLGLAAGISVIDHFRKVSRRTDEVIRSLDDPVREPGPVIETDRPRITGTTGQPETPRAD